jgi:nitrogen fixation NifU-like protein
VDPRFLNHFRSPRGAGDLAQPTARVAVENPVCGDQLSLAVRVEDGCVVDLAWRVRGCSGAIAAASALHELATARTLDEARALDAAALEAVLGPVPALKRHGLDLALDGLRAALAAHGRHDTRGESA